MNTHAKFTKRGNTRKEIEFTDIEKFEVDHNNQYFNVIFEENYCRSMRYDTIYRLITSAMDLTQG